MGHILSLSVTQAIFRARQNFFCVSMIHKIASVCGNSGAHIHYVLDLKVKCSDQTSVQQSILPFCLL